MEDGVNAEVEIINRQGLHARPVMKFVDLAARFESSITVDRGPDSERVDAKSPMHMMLLAAPMGSRLRISATGPDAAQAVQALVDLVSGGFDELESP